ncbi:L,D-transpeptidase [Jannaschia sp. W003]|uniref:L,D-transpeptidase n=1 Tax=Jannaschia sp. W003 TaxID=2867012 RepID=UPI0021A5CA90|nr:L,D-transpeptidase [Jannaschia sp. W003]UWQ21197.1 L,D-transpeptidase [Jannaschia sp. W003]
MLTRRRFALTAAAALSATAARAQVTVPRYDVPAEMLPRRVRLDTALPPGEVHVFPDSFRLYWTQADGTAIRYFVGVGKPGLYEAGRFYVGAKKTLPSWMPTPGMIEREPELYGPYEGVGLPGALDNPLGAAALYLFAPGRGDTFLRIHGTHEPHTIGTAVSNGCARLVNDQMMDLYARVPMDTPVTLHPRRG